MTTEKEAHMKKPVKDEYTSWYEYHLAREKWEKRKRVKLFCIIYGANLVLLGSLITLMLLNR